MVMASSCREGARRARPADHHATRGLRELKICARAGAEASPEPVLGSCTARGAGLVVERGLSFRQRDGGGAGNRGGSSDATTADRRAGAGALAVPALAADYTIMAPAAPGGGWDQTARTMQTVLQEDGISGNVQVTNVPGAGGTIGLAQFVNQAKGDPEELIVGGYVMVGAILTNASPVDLTMVTPIARLTGESGGDRRAGRERDPDAWTTSSRR